MPLGASVAARVGIDKEFSIGSRVKRPARTCKAVRIQFQAAELVGITRYKHPHCTHYRYAEADPTEGFVVDA